MFNKSEGIIKQIPNVSVVLLICYSEVQYWDHPKNLGLKIFELKCFA